MKLVIISNKCDVIAVEVARLSVKENNDSISFVDITGDAGEVILDSTINPVIVRDAIMGNAPAILVHGNVVS